MSIKRSHIIPTSLLTITILSGAALSSTLVSATDNTDVVDEINITVPVSCSLSGTGMTSHNANIVNGTYQADIGSTTLKAFCNDTNGFAIYATGYTGNEIGETNSNKLVGTPASIGNIDTGTATSGNTSNWAMKLATNSNATYAITLDNGFGSYSSVPNSYTKVAHRDSGTDIGATATGASLTSTYAAFMSQTQPAGTYSGQVIYTLVHPASEEPLQPVACVSGNICYNANASTAVGTMGRQSAADGNTISLFASNFSRDGYGFAGWSDAYDYVTNTSAHFYGPNEIITVPEGTTANGLALYAIWVKGAGTMQDTAKATSVCNGLTATIYNDEGDTDEITWSITANLNSVSALTDNRDGQTYAIAKLSDNNCWMIENLRLADTHQDGANTVPTTLTTTNTNNPLNDNDITNPTVTLKHNYADTITYTNLSPTSSVAYSTAPEGWCTTSYSAECTDQSRLRTDNTANRVSYATTDTMSTSSNLYSYGNYYNWYSATAGNGTYSKSSGDTIGDLCPIGWHLPTGGDSGEFILLSNSLGGQTSGYMTSSTIPTAAIMMGRLRHFPNNFLQSGSVNGASIINRGSYGSYPSSTAKGGSIYWLGISSNHVIPGTTATSDKHAGHPLRCLISPST